MLNLALPYLHAYVDPSDLADIGNRVRSIDSRISAHTANIERNNLHFSKKLAASPLVTVEFCRTLGFKPPRGPWLRSQPVNKAAQLRIVGDAGLAVPHWTRYERGMDVSEADFGPFVMIKSTVDGKSHGMGNVLVRTRDFDSVRPVMDRTYAGIGAPTAIIQRFIDTGQYPSHHRILLFFSQTIVSRFAQTKTLSSVYSPSMPLFAKESIASNSGERDDFLNIEPDVLNFAERCASCFPQTPLVALDIIRSAADGKLYFLEANIGNVWVFSAQTSMNQRQRLGGVEKIKAQFGAFDVCAAVLARKAAELAK